MPDLQPPATALSPRPDRRQRRVPDPPCPHCGGEHTHGATRSEYVVYFRCRGCLHTWSVPKPGVQAFG
jgi:hypothetical protein